MSCTTKQRIHAIWRNIEIGGRDHVMAKSKVCSEHLPWLARVCEAEAPPDSVVAYNFGLFEGAGGYTAYPIGADRYDDEDSDWACDETFTPAERYCSLATESFKG